MYRKPFQKKLGAKRLFDLNVKPWENDTEVTILGENFHPAEFFCKIRKNGKKIKKQTKLEV